jgi:hypothetical protein
LAAFRFRVAAAFLPEAERAVAGRFAAAAPPILPPRLDDTFVSFLPPWEPLLFPPLRPAVFELVINQRTAREVGLTIPTQLMALADEVPAYGPG